MFHWCFRCGDQERKINELGINDTKRTNYERKLGRKRDFGPQKLQQMFLKAWQRARNYWKTKRNKNQRNQSIFTHVIQTEALNPYLQVKHIS